MISPTFTPCRKTPSTEPLDGMTPTGNPRTTKRAAAFTRLISPRISDPGVTWWALATGGAFVAAVASFAPGGDECLVLHPAASATAAEMINRDRNDFMSVAC